MAWCNRRINSCSYSCVSSGRRVGLFIDTRTASFLVFLKWNSDISWPGRFPPCSGPWEWGRVWLQALPLFHQRLQDWSLLFLRTCCAWCHNRSKHVAWCRKKSRRMTFPSPRNHGWVVHSGRSVTVLTRIGKFVTRDIEAVFFLPLKKFNDPFHYRQGQWCPDVHGRRVGMHYDTPVKRYFASRKSYASDCRRDWRCPWSTNMTCLRYTSSEEPRGRATSSIHVMNPRDVVQPDVTHLVYVRII